MAGVMPSHPLIIQAGDDRPLVWSLTDSNTGQAVSDLTGYSARAQVRGRTDDADVLQEWSTAAGTAVLADSRLSLRVNGSASWTWQHGVYDVAVTDPSGTTEIVDHGPAVLLPVVTR